MSETTGLRADAERNRRAILSAASAAFARRGSGISLDEVARDAGVGIATLYRRFPTRDALVEAVFEHKMSEYADAAMAAAERATTDPWPAFHEYVTFILEQQADDPAFAEVLIAPLLDSPVFREQHGLALTATLRLVERVTAAGVVRAGFVHSDLYLLTLANAGLVRSTGLARREASRRFGAFMLEAFRATSAEHPGQDAELPPVPRVWSGTGRRRKPAGGAATAG